MLPQNINQYNYPSLDKSIIPPLRHKKTKFEILRKCVVKIDLKLSIINCFMPTNTNNSN